MEEVTMQNVALDSDATETSSYETSMGVSLDDLDAYNSGQLQGTEGSGFFLISWVVIVLAMIASMWKVFSKAKLPGWGILIPIYNVYLGFKLAGKPAWTWSILLPPLAGILYIIAQFKVAEKFGKGSGFALGLVFLPFVFYPILAWGEAQYQEEAAPVLQ